MAVKILQGNEIRLHPVIISLLEPFPIHMDQLEVVTEFNDNVQIISIVHIATLMVSVCLIICLVMQFYFSYYASAEGNST